MKKVLFATTALVATAGMAAADVSISGSGRFGLVYNSGADAVAATGSAGQITAATTAVTTAQTQANTDAATVATNTANGTLAPADITTAATSAAALANAQAVLDAINGTNSVDSTIKAERRITFNIDGSGSTDGGLEFGGRIRLRSDEGDTSGGIASGNVYMGNDMFRVTVGNTDGALLNRVGYYQGTVGLTGLHWGNVSFNIGASRWDLNSFSSRGNTGDVVRLDFNVGGLGVSLSTDTTGTDIGTDGSENAISMSYNFGDWKVAAGYAQDASVSLIAVGGIAAGTVGDAYSLSAVGSIGDFGVGLGYTDKERIGSKVTLSGSYNFGDTTVTAFVANTSEDIAGSAGINAVTGSDTELGIGFAHSLGGATLSGGVSRNYQKNTMADLGVSFSF